MSTVLHGSNTIAKPVFADSPAIGQVYVPARLKKIMDKVEAGGEASRNNQHSDMEDDNEQEEDYVIPDEKPKQTKRPEKKKEREAFVPMNIYDLQE